MRSTPLTILHVDSAREYRGGQNQARLLMAGLAEHPFVRQALLTSAGSRLAAEARTLGVHVRTTPWRLPVDHRALGALRRAFGEDWDVVHPHDGHAVQAVLLARAQEGIGTRVLAARRVDFPARRPFVWQRADLIAAVSRHVRDVLVEQGIDRRRIEVVHSGIDEADLSSDRARAEAAALRAAARADEEDLLVAAAGALVAHKDHATFVRAAALVAAEHARVRFAVFGEGQERAALERLVDRLGLSGRFRLPGAHPALARSLGGIDVFVMPSREEGLGTACIEAMLAGRPVVGTGAGGLAELAEDGGFRPVPAEDPDALAAEILRLVGDPDARRRASEAARRGSTRFTASRMVAGTLRCYRVLRRRPT